MPLSSRLATLGALLLTASCTSGRAPQAKADVSAVPPSLQLHPSTGTNSERALNAPYVILVSLDGFRHDYLDHYPAPNIMRVASAGVRADRMIPVFPSKTFPAHYTVATGLYAEHHGIVGNSFWDAKKGARYSLSDRAAKENGSWYRGEPIWVTAESQGMVTGDYFFVGGDAAIMGVRPTYRGGDEGKVTRDERVSGTLGWLSLPPSTRPHLITLYMEDVDGAGHQFGPGSVEVGEAIARVDSSVGRLLDGVKALSFADRVFVIIVSDHGMTASPMAATEELDMARFPGVRLSQSGPYAGLLIEQGGGRRAAQIRDSLNAVLQHGKAYLRRDVPARFHYNADPNIGDVVVLMQSPWSIVAPDDRPTADGFGHGWDNTDADMGAIFLAMGPGIRAGQRIAPFESVNVYPFIAHLLGLVANRRIDGRLEVLQPVLSPR